MSRRKKKESLVIGRMLKKIAPSIGATIFLEPIWGIAGQITFKSGRRSYFRYNTVDLNPVGAADIAKDKDYANLFMRRLGYPIVPKSKTFFSTDWADAIKARGRGIDDAYRYAASIGFPVVVKPNSGSQGSGVAVVRNKREFYRAMREIFRKDRVGLVQQTVTGRDYRLVVLDNELISAYERIPLSIIGNGRSTIETLLRAKQQEFRSDKRDTKIEVDDPRIREKLRSQGLTLRSVPQRGERIYLLDNANLSAGGDSVDVTHEVHLEFRDLAIRLTRDMGLRLCGVDLMVDGNISDPPKRFWVLEINAAPGLDHYAKSGRAQQAVVEDLYRKVLMAIDK